MAQGLPSGGFEDGAAGMQLPPEITSLVELEELVLYQSRNFLYSTVAMFTLLFYDYLITLNMEAKYIWASKDRISLTNALFVLNRYLPILRAFGYMVFSLRPPQEEPTCSAWTDANSYTTMISIGVVEILMGLRTWALWGKSRLIGIILLSVFVTAVCTSIVTVNLRLPPIRGIIPLAPTSILPCDRPSPYKYVLSYCAALVVELTTFVFMMGRIFHLIIKSKSQSRSRSGSIRNRSLALPIIRGLQRHGMSYFMAVIFVMAFTVISSYSSRLARMIVNAGLAPTITSIACNRVIFALRGLYLEITVGERESSQRGPTTGLHLHPFTQSIMRRSKGPDDLSPADGKRVRISDHRQKHPDGSYEYDEEIAMTRHDADTKDLSAGVDYPLQYRGRDQDSPNADETEANTEQNRMANTARRVAFPDTRRLGLRAPFHVHGASASTVMTSDSSLMDGGDDDDGGSMSTPTAANFRNGHGGGWGHPPRGTSKSSFKFMSNQGSPSPHANSGVGAARSRSRTTAVATVTSSPHLNTNVPLVPPVRPGHSGAGDTVKRSLSSLSGIIRAANNREESGAAATSSDMAEDVTSPNTPRSTHGLVEKFGSIWRRLDGRDGGSSRAYHDGVGASSGNANNDSFGEEPTRGRTRGRDRERDRHPLDHHYEMDTIHSDLMHEQQWSLGELEGTELEGDEETGDVDPAAVNPLGGNAARTGAGGSAASLDRTRLGDTPYISRKLDRSSQDHQLR